MLPKTHCCTQRFWWKRYVALRVFKKKHNSASSLNMLYLAKTTQFYSAFRQQRLVLLRTFSKNAKFLKMHSYEDKAKFYSAFLATTLSHAKCFRWKWGVIKIWNIWVNLKKIFENIVCSVFCIVSDWKMQKKSLQTHYENLVHVCL